MKSQNEQVLALLRRGSVTAMSALRLCNCFRLAARINELRRAGHDIETRWIRYGGKRYAAYDLIKENVREG